MRKWDVLAAGFYFVEVFEFYQTRTLRNNDDLEVSLSRSIGSVRRDRR